uniref:Uncharacterized protein n=1 Tax=Entomoneis paludosa TaxID=265537 RepID=A0A6U3AV84_9STRA|mmetsp:Transcript_23295/g.48403  ORF Transcript_23295/g.48403 Transcript_23295/m.48403 type:complete len:223 (+) Transcript_23295:281-949(+)
MLGDFQGTPTIRLYTPKAKQGNSNSKKIVKDYQYERKAVDMKRFLDENMPNFIERVSGLSDLTKFQDKAQRHGLPQVLLFTSKAKTLSLTKYLSTEFRRRLLLAEIHPTKTNQKVLEQYGISPDQLPAMIVIPSSTNNEEGSVGATEEMVIRYEGDGFTRHKLQSFLSKHALKDKVFPAKKKEEAEEGAPPKKTDEDQEKDTTTTTNAKEKVKVGAGVNGEL